MRDWWYGDKRDIVKWAAIFVLAERHGIHRVMQVALYRPDPPKYKLSINDTTEPEFLPDKVIRHFRDLDDIHRLEKKVGLRIDVHKDIFEGCPEFPTRKDFGRAYFNKVAEKIRKYAEPIIVLLDPDTGIAPQTCTDKHVTPEEIQIVLKAMKLGDLLLFYQHARSRDREWRNPTREDFRKAVGRDAPVSVIACNEIANDVVFFVVEWSKWCESAPSNSNVKLLNEKKRLIVRNGVIINTDELTAREVIGRRVLCPACHTKEFKTWSQGWDGHAGSKCPDAHGDSAGQRRAYFKHRFAHLFQS